MAMVKDFQHAISVASSGGMRDLQALFSQLGLRSSPKVFDVSCFIKSVLWIKTSKLASSIIFNSDVYFSLCRSADTYKHLAHVEQGKYSFQEICDCECMPLFKHW